MVYIKHKLIKIAYKIYPTKNFLFNGLIYNKSKNFVINWYIQT